MSVLIPIIALVAAIWALVYARYGSLLVGATAFVAIGYVLNNNALTLSLGPVSLTSARLIIAGLAMMFAWRWYRGKIDRRPLTGCDWLVILFTGYLTIRYVFTPAPPVDGSSVSPTWRLIASFWMPAALYWIVRYAELNERAWKWMLVGLTGLGVYLGLTALAEVHQQWWAVYPKFIADPTLGTHFGRARGPALMSASLGVFLTVCFWSAWFFVVARWEACAVRARRHNDAARIGRLLHLHTFDVAGFGWRTGSGSTAAYATIVEARGGRSNALGGWVWCCYGGRQSAQYDPEGLRRVGRAFRLSASFLPACIDEHVSRCAARWLRFWSLFRLQAAVSLRSNAANRIRVDPQFGSPQ